MAAVDFTKIRQRNRETSRVVHVASWGGDVTIERLTPAERLDLMLAVQRSGLIDEEGNVEVTGETFALMAGAVSRSIVNEHGVREFDSDAGRDELLDHIEAITELLNDVLQLNGIGSADETETDDEKKTDSTTSAS